MKPGFREMLALRQIEIDSLVCVGLDILPDKLPLHLSEVAGGIDAETYVNWFTDMVDATAEFASMFKPQSAHYEAMEEGRWILWQIINYIRRNYPDIPIVLDCKRGDIGRTQARYRIAHLLLDAVHGMNFSPYMGKTCMQALVDPTTAGKAIVGLCYTSNPDAREVQDVKLADGRCYWEFIAERTLSWASEFGVTGDAGLVMAAAYKPDKAKDEIFSAHLKKCREIVGSDLWFLIPGIGTQGGEVKETVEAAFSVSGQAKAGQIAINSSSGITFASNGEDFAEAAAAAAETLRDQIREAGGSV